MKKRLVTLFVTSCLLASHAGCIPAENRASDHQDLVTCQMSQAEVRSALGQGDAWAPNDGHGGEMWHYSYGSAADAKKIVAETFLYLFLIVTIVGILVLVARDGGTTPDLDRPGDRSAGSKQPERVHFFVYFDSEGNVRGVSGLQPCHD